jgi:hypothetical protein
MSEMVQEQNKALVLDAFDTLFNKGTTRQLRSFGHLDNAHIEPGAKDCSTL